MTVTATDYKLHPAADLFEPMTADEFAGLKADIAEHGQRVKIVLWKGQIIDGRHRLQACNELGCEPKIEELGDDEDPWAYAISSNLHRRHLTTGQRAMIANKLATLRNGQRAAHLCAPSQSASQADAAKALNVSRRSVQNARQVEERGSESVAQAVKSGELPLTKATELVAAVPDKQEQSTIVAQGKSAVDAAVKTAKPSQPTLPAMRPTMEDVKAFMDGATESELADVRALVSDPHPTLPAMAAAATRFDTYEFIDEPRKWLQQNGTKTEWIILLAYLMEYVTKDADGETLKKIAEAIACKTMRVQFKPYPEYTLVDMLLYEIDQFRSKDMPKMSKVKS